MRIICLVQNWSRDWFCEVFSILGTIIIFLVARACTWKHQMGKIQDPVASFADPFHLGSNPSYFRKPWGMSAFHPFRFSGKCYKVLPIHTVYTKDISDLLRQVLCKCCNTWLKASAYRNTLKSLDITQDWNGFFPIADLIQENVLAKYSQEENSWYKMNLKS